MTQLILSEIPCEIPSLLVQNCLQGDNAARILTLLFLLPTAINRKLVKNGENMHFTEIESVVVEDLHNCSIFSHQLLAIDFLLNKQSLKLIITINFSVNK